MKKYRKFLRPLSMGMALSGLLGVMAASAYDVTSNVWSALLLWVLLTIFFSIGTVLSN